MCSNQHRLDDYAQPTNRSIDGLHYSLSTRRRASATARVVNKRRMVYESGIVCAWTVSVGITLAQSGCLGHFEDWENVLRTRKNISRTREKFRGLGETFRGLGRAEKVGSGVKSCSSRRLCSSCSSLRKDRATLSNTAGRGTCRGVLRTGGSSGQWSFRGGRWGPRPGSRTLRIGAKSVGLAGRPFRNRLSIKLEGVRASPSRLMVYVRSARGRLGSSLSRRARAKSDSWASRGLERMTSATIIRGRILPRT